MTSFEMKVQLACSRSLPFWDALEMARTAGRAAAEEGLPCESELIALVSSRIASWGRPSLRFEFERAYWSCAKASIDEFFSLDAKGKWLSIKSQGVYGASGEVSLHSSHLDDFFNCALLSDFSSYDSWARNPYPVGGHTVLLRNDSWCDDDKFDDAGYVQDENYGLLTIDPDTHPSSGFLIMGDVEHEAKQLGILWQAGQLGKRLLSMHAPDESDISAAATRMRELSGTARKTFSPGSGFCSQCGSDISILLSEMREDEMVTGCPVCGSTWCD